MENESENNEFKILKVEQSTIVDLQAELARKESSISKLTTKNVQKSTISATATSKDPVEYSDYVSKNTFKKILANTGRFMCKQQPKKLEHFPPNEPNPQEMDFIDAKLRQSRLKLEQKSKLYDQLHDGNLKDERDGLTGESRYLVDFEAVDSTKDKIIENKRILLAKGIELAESEYREKMNKKWMDQKSKQKDVEHYQDILNDELRQHGTGYFAFSTDEPERESQLNLLNQLRSTTVKEREKSENKNQQNQERINKRLAAIRKRRNMNNNEQVAKKSKTSCENNETNPIVPEDIINSLLRESKNKY